MKRLHATHAKSKPRRDAIIRAALECFVEKGFTDTSIVDICRRAQASTGSVYHHFKSKPGLAAAVYLSGIQDYQNGLIETLARQKKAMDGIFALIDFHLKWVEQHENWARYLFQHRHAEFMAEDNTENSLNQLNLAFSRGLADWFQGYVKTGTFRKLPKDIFISLLFGACQEYARQYLAGFAVTDVDNASKEIAKGVWAALT